MVLLGSASPVWANCRLFGPVMPCLHTDRPKNPIPLLPITRTPVKAKKQQGSDSRLLREVVCEAGSIVLLYCRSIVLLYCRSIVLSLVSIHRHL